MKPKFNGYLKMFLHDDDPERLVSRAETTEDWVTKRWKILKKPRRFSIRFHIVDKDGNKCGHEVVDFLNEGKDKDLSHAIYKTGRKFINELRDEGFDVDSVNSYAVIRA